MEAVVSGILNEGETMSDEDRAVIEQMYDNGLFKFNGDDTLKDPASLTPATRKTLIGKIDGILAQEGLSDRAKELITEYRNALAGLDEKKERDEEKGDDRVDPNEYFSKPPEDIVKDLMDRGVLIDKDGKVQFTMADADIKKVAKAFGMSVANFKKAVTKALKGTKGAGAGGAGGDSGGDNNDTGGLRPDYNALNGLGNLGQNPQSGDIYNVLGRAFGAKASEVQGELEGPLADMMKDAKDETDAMVKAKDFVLQHFGNHALTENQRNTLTTLASVLGKNAWVAYKSNQGGGAGGNPGGETGGPNPDGEAGGTGGETGGEEAGGEDAGGEDAGGEGAGGEEQGETPITWPNNGNKKAKLAAISDAIKRFDENPDTKTDLVDMYRKAVADPKMSAYLKNKEFIELKKRAEVQAKARGETLETPPPGGQDEKGGEKPKDESVEKAYESLRQNMGKWNGGRAAREKGEVETYTSLSDFTREAGNDLLLLTKNQKEGKKDTEYENAVKFVEDMFFNEYTGFRNNYLSFQKQYEIGKANGLSDDDENQKNLLRKMNTIKASYNTFKQILDLDPNNAGARFDGFDNAFNPVGGKRSDYGGEEDKEREEREKLHEKINDRNDLKNFSYDDLWNEIKDIPANSPKKRRESWVRLLTKLQGDDLSDDVEKDGARVMGSKKAAANLRSMLFTKDGKLIKNFQSLPEDEKKTFDALMEKYHLPKVFGTNTDNGGPAPDAGAPVPPEEPAPETKSPEEVAAATAEYFNPERFVKVDEKGNKTGFASTDFGAYTVKSIQDYVARAPDADPKALKVIYRALKGTPKELHEVGPGQGKISWPSGEVYIPGNQNDPENIGAVFHELAHYADQFHPENAYVHDILQPIQINALRNKIRNAIPERTKTKVRIPPEIDTYMKNYYNHASISYLKAEESVKAAEQTQLKNLAAIAEKHGLDLTQYKSLREAGPAIMALPEGEGKEELADRFQIYTKYLESAKRNAIEKYNEDWARRGKMYGEDKDPKEYDNRTEMGRRVNRSMRMLCDIYDAIYNGKLYDEAADIVQNRSRDISLQRVNAGHGSGYYGAYHPTDKRISEIFANYVSLSITMPGAINILKRDLPQLVDALDKYTDWLIGDVNYDA